MGRYESRDARSPARSRGRSRLPQPLRVQCGLAGVELEDDELEALYAELDERNIVLSDDCGRTQKQGADVRQRRPRARDDRFAPALPQRGGSLPAPHRRGGGRAREARRARRPAGQGHDDQLEPPARGVDREAVPGPRPLAARPDPGGRDRADPGRREVRLAPGLQVLDLCDVVDSPGRATRRREQVAHDPDPGAHRASARPESAARNAS